MTGGSIHFGTENLVFVPEGDALRFYDLYLWRVARLRTHSAGVRLRPGVANQVVESIRGLLADYLKTPAGRERPDDVREKADRFTRALINSARAAEPPMVSGNWLATRTAPARLTLWTRLSDAPAESYFEEDYDTETAAVGNILPTTSRSGGECDGSPATGAGPGVSDGPLASAAKSIRPGSGPAETTGKPGVSRETGDRTAGQGRLGIPVYGSILLNQFDGAEMTLAESGPDAAFLLEIDGEEDLQVEEIDPRAALPIVEEYCGVGGASNRGNTVNYTLHSRLAAEKLGCAPLHRVGGAGFATLYFHYETELARDVLIRFKAKRLAVAVRTIRSLGYSLIGEGRRHQIWERAGEGDILHLYLDLPGRESEMMPVLSPFVLAVKARGGFDPAERSRLIGELAKRGRPEGD